MPDRMAVIDKLNDMADYLRNKSYSDLLARDFYDTVGYAIALLKKQEEEIEKLNRFVNGFSRDAIPVVRCKNCKQSGIDSTIYPQYWCSAHAEYHDEDWYCADGERREDNA